MPLIQGAHDGRAATVTIAIVDAAKFKEHKQSENPVFQGATPCRALIDTGATSTMIARRVVEKTGLQQSHDDPGSGAGRRNMAPGLFVPGSVLRAASHGRGGA